MTYPTLLVHLDGAGSNAAVLDVAATLAQRYDSDVIGIAACQPLQFASSEGYMDPGVAAIERDIVREELARAKADFDAHAALRPHILEWRSIPTLINLAHIVAEHARCADLVITSVGPRAGDLATHADTGDLIVRAGRPVLVVPAAPVTADFRTVVVAWNDTRECRRAILDALPMLHAADHVTIVEASSDPESKQDGLVDVAGWLARHAIAADRRVVRTKGSTSETLAAIADELGADLMVAGAYGHSRIREWAFGGVTRDLLLNQRRCTLLAH